MLVLGIESSCDETGIALYDGTKGLLASVLHSQVTVHSAYGGVVPELASRDHLKYIVPLVNEALNKANCNKSDLTGVAYTAGPGLVGALLTGASFAKSLAFGLQISAIAINHLEAHILAAKLCHSRLDFPFLALLVSGGHTEIILAHALGQYELLGETLDDAAGEAFDKVAKLMGIPYPGGAKLASIADECIEKSKYVFPRPMTNVSSLNFSFSGLKTNVLNTWSKSDQTLRTRALIAKAFQEAVIETLIIKCKRALKQTQSKQLVVAGGVAANRELRQQLNLVMTELNVELYFPHLQYCTDNGAMIAYAGYLYLAAGKYDDNYCIEVKPRWKVENKKRIRN